MLICTTTVFVTNFYRFRFYRFLSIFIIICIIIFIIFIIFHHFFYTEIILTGKSKFHYNSAENFFINKSGKIANVIRSYYVAYLPDERYVVPAYVPAMVVLPTISSTVSTISRGGTGVVGGGGGGISISGSGGQGGSDRGGEGGSRSSSGSSSSASSSSSGRGSSMNNVNSNQQGKKRSYEAMNEEIDNENNLEIKEIKEEKELFESKKYPDKYYIIDIKTNIPIWVTIIPFHRNSTIKEIKNDNLMNLKYSNNFYCADTNNKNKKFLISKVTFISENK